MDALPNEILEQIFSQLDIESKKALRVSSQRCRAFATPQLFYHLTCFTHVRADPLADDDAFLTNATATSAHRHARSLRLRCCRDYPHDRLLRVDSHDCGAVELAPLDPLPGHTLAQTLRRARTPDEKPSRASFAAAWPLRVSLPTALSAASATLTDLTLVGRAVLALRDPAAARVFLPCLRRLLVAAVPDRPDMPDDDDDDDDDDGGGSAGAVPRLEPIAELIGRHARTLRSARLCGARELDVAWLLRAVGARLQLGTFFFRESPLMLARTTAGARAGEFDVRLVDPSAEVAAERFYYGFNADVWGVEWRRMRDGDV